MNNETVWKSVCVNTMQTTHTVLPLIFQTLSLSTNDVVTGSTRVLRTHFKTCGKHDAIQFVLNAISHNAFFGNAIYAFTLRINQTNAGQVKGFQIFVVETGTLTELPIVWLQ